MMSISSSIRNTHLHYEHFGGNTLFRNASFVIQAAEWEYAGRPLSPQAMYYQEFLIGREPLAYFRWRFANGVADTGSHARGINRSRSIPKTAS
ncbi:MBL fold metallo-hydrolase [Paraburkholderia nemoris]|uniref:Metallo-beta-lactamase domain-containing protein n=1 Tax=Paraburkholderia nemoris TaxID=2793076 RepID=A0ABM8QYE1_9BURK|nr:MULTISPECIES: MBL fold metallo-hydrolase [Paraburkholderia]CAE6723265.1 hypothetical protein R69776_01635 [Paraburkholderia nemoris]CAE6749806.1 hypothetical protein R75777_02934 [Paraburkholderia nemoris]